MRGLVPNLPTPHPTGERLPALFQEDPFALGVCAGVDEVLAPIFATLDSLDAYVDVQLSPEDFLSFLARWVGIDTDEGWPVERRRALVSRAVDIFRQRGTVNGLRAHVGLLTGGVVEIAETGGCSSSETSGGSLPGESEPRMTVRVRVDDPAAVDERALDRLIADAKPAHVVHRLEVVAR